MAHLRLLAVCLLILAVSGVGSYLLMGDSSSRPPAVPSASPSTQADIYTPEGCEPHAFIEPQGDLERFGYPTSGFFAPSQGPDAGTLGHALQHGWTVIKYNAGLDSAERELLEQWTADQTFKRLVVVSGGKELPWKVAAVNFNGQLHCQQVTLPVLRGVAQLAAGR